MPPFPTLPFPLSLPIKLHGGVKGRQGYVMFNAFRLARVKGRGWGNGLLLLYDMTPCLLSPFLTLPVTPQTLQISPPGPGGAEDPGSSQKEGQEQHLQCSTHEGLFLLPQSPLHHLWTPGVSCFFFLTHFLLKSGLRWQKRNFKIRTQDFSGCKHLVTRMETMVTQLWRKHRSKESGPKTAHLTPPLHHACHLWAHTGCVTRCWVLDWVT